MRLAWPVHTTPRAMTGRCGHKNGQGGHLEHLETGRKLEAVSGSWKPCLEAETRGRTGPGPSRPLPPGQGFAHARTGGRRSGVGPQIIVTVTQFEVQTKKRAIWKTGRPRKRTGSPPPNRPPPPIPPTLTRGDAAPGRAQRAADRASGATPLVAVTALAKWPFRPSSLPALPETRRRTCTARLAPPNPGRCFAHARTGGAAGRVSGPKS